MCGGGGGGGGAIHQWASRCGSLRPSVYADVRYIDAVIAIEGPQWVSIGGVAEAKEDCLFLNVYAPTATLPTATSPAANGAGTGGLPVMVYFPAGQFMWGSGNDGENFNAPQTVAGEQVILVTMNYRLGALGFLALDELRSRDTVSNSTGNYGVQDQRAALKWVKENAAAFGGDPDKIVLWGESAGAAAVTAHLAMEKSWPYFSRAVMESGAFQTWSYRTWRDSNANALSFATHVNCTTVDDATGAVSADVDCLLKLTPAELVNFGDDGNGVANARYVKKPGNPFLPITCSVTLMGGCDSLFLLLSTDDVRY